MNLIDKARAHIASIFQPSNCACGHARIDHKPNTTPTGECRWFDCRCGKTLSESVPVEAMNLVANRIGVDLKGTLQTIKQIKDTWLK